MAKPLLRDRALELRKQGYSYRHIAEHTNVSKGTLSVWLANVPYIPNAETIEKIGKARAASGLAKHRIKINSLEKAATEAKKDIGHLSRRDLFMVGLGLYVGEGTKTHNIIRVINGNPKIIQFAVKWFQSICGLSVSNFRIRLHLYPDNDITESVRYWSEETSIPETQFYKVQIDTRKDKKAFKRGKLPFGTAHLCVLSNGKKEFGAFLARKINAWIAEVLK